MKTINDLWKDGPFGIWGEEQRCRELACKFQLLDIGFYLRPLPELVKLGLPIIVTGMFPGYSKLQLESLGVKPYLVIDKGIPYFPPEWGKFDFTWDEEDVTWVMQRLADAESKETLLALYQRMKDGKSIEVPFSDYPKYSHPQCHVHSRDVVYDVGAWEGDSAIWFCCEAPWVRVICFEPTPSTYSVLVANLTQYVPTCQSGSRAVAFHGGLSDVVGALSVGEVEGNSSANHLDEANSGESVQVWTGDGWCADSGRSPNFVKMDVEGHELRALHGLRNTIKDHRPDLAICVYHRKQDLREITQYVLDTCPTYRLYLGHHRFGPCETVLYATTRGGGQ